MTLTPIKLYLSIDEVALIDLPAMFHTILQYTAEGSKVIYIGHSLGTATALMYGSDYPEESKRIVKMFVMLCPAYTLSQMISPYRLFAPFGDFIVVSTFLLRTSWKNIIISST